VANRNIRFAVAEPNVITCTPDTTTLERRSHRGLQAPNYRWDIVIALHDKPMHVPRFDCHGEQFVSVEAGGALQSDKNGMALAGIKKHWCLGEQSARVMFEIRRRRK